MLYMLYRRGRIVEGGSNVRQEPLDLAFQAEPGTSFVFLIMFYF